MSEMALRLPNSYVDVKRDEMEYVDGGNFIYDLTISTLGTLISAAVVATGIKVKPYMVIAAVGAYSWMGTTVASAAAVMAVNPVASAALLAGCTGVAANYIIRHYGK